MTEETALQIIDKLNNIDILLQASTGAIYIMIGVIIACTIAILFGGWLRDL